MNSRELFEGFQYVEDRYLTIADNLEKEIMQMKRNQKRPKSISILIAAAICASILATTALAATMIPGIFRAMQEQHPEEEALYSAAAQANTDALAEVKEVPDTQLDFTRFTLFERYYDGETILLGYDLSAIMPEPLVGYVPENGDWSAVKVMEDFASVAWEHPQPWEGNPVTENALAENFPAGAQRMDIMFQAILSPEAYDQAWKMLRENGYVCVRTHDFFVGDHIYVNGADIFEVLSETVWSMREDYEVEEGSCIRLNPLPEAGRNQDSVTVTLKIKSSERYWYLDMEGNTYYGTGSHQTNEIDFTLDNVTK